MTGEPPVLPSCRCLAGEVLPRLGIAGPAERLCCSSDTYALDLLAGERLSTDWRGSPPGAEGSPRAVMGEVAFEKRGPRAWDNFETLPLRPLHEGGLRRLLVHSVGDSTAAQWLPRVREFLGVCKRQGLTLTRIRVSSSWPRIAALLRRSLPDVGGERPPSPRFAQLKNRHKLAVTIEGGPMCEEAIFALACYMLAKSLFPEAAWILVQYDCYTRGQDMESLSEQDVAWDGSHVAVAFGVASRGDSVKGGSNQGAVLRRGPIANLLLGLKENTIKGELIFPFTQAHLREHWHRACAALGLGFAGPPHRPAPQWAFRGPRPWANFARSGPPTRPLEGHGVGSTLHEDLRPDQVPRPNATSCARVRREGHARPQDGADQHTLTSDFGPGPHEADPDLVATPCSCS